GLFGLGFLQFSESEIVLFLSISFLVSLASATQDIAIDGYTVEQFDKSSLGWQVPCKVLEWRLVCMVGGAGTLWLYQRFDWQMATISLATTVVLISCSLWFLKDQDNPKHATNISKASLIRLIKRPQTKWLLALIVVFRFVEAPMMAMLNPMLVDFGFSLSQIGLLFSVFGAIVGIGSALLAGVLIKYIDIVRCLILFGWLRTAVYALLCLGLLYPLLGDFLPAVGLFKNRVYELDGN
ncbi:MFS transporter, partial [Neisseria meningitidis]|uniref:MFS transporter n=1 Tax=Neisseria meningitidis TaxID=487 RepID=UPI00355B6485